MQAQHYRHYVFVLLISSIVLSNLLFISLRKKHVGFQQELSLKQNKCEIAIHNTLKYQVTDYRLNKLLTVCDQKHHFDRIISIYKEFAAILGCPVTAGLMENKKPLVALASFPGSGNTMTRRIIESLTGILVATNHISTQCSSSGFSFVIKTHATNFKAGGDDCKNLNVKSLNYFKAIYIIRNPYKAMLAEYNRSNKLQGTQIPLISNGTYFGERWKQFVEHGTIRWKETTIFWINSYKKPVHILFYENILKDRFREVYHLANFIGVNITFKSLLCTFSKYVEKEKRQFPNQAMEVDLFDIYDSGMRSKINSVIVSTMKAIYLKQLKNYILKENS